MFSDFTQHVIGVPQIAPAVGDPLAGNTTFDGPEHNEDFGLEQVTGDPNDRYSFRTSPLRNVALQPTFFHNGAFTRLEDARLLGWKTRVYSAGRRAFTRLEDARLLGWKTLFDIILM
jgi:cytochrome c peroxidase